MEYIVIALIVLLGVVSFLLLKRQAGQGPTDNAQLLLLQQQIDGIRVELSKSLQSTSDALAGSLKNTSDILFQSVRDATANINQQLSRVTQQMQEQTNSVGSRLDNASRVIGDVQKNLGQLGQATQEIKELGQSVSKLDELLRAPKLRGGLGEAMLEDLLKQVLPADAYEMQYRFRNGQAVDAVVKTSGRMIPIDSKFPLENFRKMLTTEVDADRRAFQRSFIGDVKKHVDAIASKYIVPDEGTFDFALMYIPAENVYYETIIKDESSSGNDLRSYAIEKHVVPVSPNSFYAYLQVIALGLKGLQIERNATAIIANLTRLQSEIGKVRDAFDVLGSHLDNARKKYEEADKRLTHFEDRIENVAERSLAPSSAESDQRLLS
jgi:DNA recombination protein RmuC